MIWLIAYFREADPWFLGLTLLCLVGAGFTLAYIITPQRRKTKKPLRTIEMFDMIFLAVVFLLADPEMPGMYSGSEVAIGVMMLILLLIAEIIVDWRRG